MYNVLNCSKTTNFHWLAISHSTVKKTDLRIYVCFLNTLKIALGAFVWFCDFNIIFLLQFIELWHPSSVSSSNHRNDWGSDGMLISRCSAAQRTQYFFISFPQFTIHLIYVSFLSRVDELNKLAYWPLHGCS